MDLMREAELEPRVDAEGTYSDDVPGVKLR